MIDFPVAAWLLALVAGLLTVCGLASVAAGAISVRRFARRPRRFARYRPAVTVLKPLCGDEPMLEQALASICAQDYPNFQVVFGVQDASDPALLVVRRVQDRFPDCDIDVVTHADFHGPNRKISNLINMMPMARHEVLVFSDSDLHVPPDYLEQIVVSLEAPRVGLVTTVCAGLPTSPGAASRLGATVISHTFLPSALLSRVMGREDCLGTTMALRRDTLARIGGLHSLVSHLADDAVLGNRIHGLGLRIEVAATVPMTAVPEPSMRALWQHELRWARTIRSLEPMLFALSIVQFPLFWAIAATVLSGGALWSAVLLAVSWTTRVAAARWTDRILHRDRQAPGAASIWLLPLRDFMSVAQVAASYLGHRVIWRGQIMRADNRRATGRVTQPFAKL